MMPTFTEMKAKMEMLLADEDLLAKQSNRVIKWVMEYKSIQEELDYMLLCWWDTRKSLEKKHDKIAQRSGELIYFIHKYAKL